MGDLTGAQIRMARGYLRWTVADLAGHSGVGASTIKRAEIADGVPPITKPNLKAIESALRQAGVAFIAENGGGAGVRLAGPGATKEG